MRVQRSASRLQASQGRAQTGPDLLERERVERRLLLFVGVLRWRRRDRGGDRAVVVVAARSLALLDGRGRGLPRCFFIEEAAEELEDFEAIAGPTPGVGLEETEQDFF